jgi:hypothetical protein
MRNSIVIEILPDDYSYEILNDVMLSEERGSWAKQSAYAAAWKYLIYIEIIKKLNEWGPRFKTGASAKIYRYLRDEHRSSQLNPISLLISYLKRIEAVKIGKYEASIKAAELRKLYKLEEIKDLIPALKDLCRRVKIFVLVDELDRGWNASEDANSFIGGLIQASLELNQTSPNLRVLVSVRRELYDNIPSLYQDAEKYRDVIETLTWDKGLLYQLITKRIRYTVPGLQESDDDRCWNSVFVAEMKEARTSSFDYIVDRTLYRPREIISFCSMSLEVARRRMSQPIGMSAIYEAESSYSTDRMNDIVAEYRYQYPGLKSIFELFRGKPSIFRRDELMDLCLRTTLGEYRIDEAAGWVADMNEEHLIRVLWNVGFLKAQRTSGSEALEREKPAYIGSHEIGQIDLSNVQSFQVTPMFHAYLWMK